MLLNLFKSKGKIGEIEEKIKAHKNSPKDIPQYNQARADHDAAQWDLNYRYEAMTQADREYNNMIVQNAKALLRENDEAHRLWEQRRYDLLNEKNALLKEISHYENLKTDILTNYWAVFTKDFNKEIRNANALYRNALLEIEDFHLDLKNIQTEIGKLKTKRQQSKLEERIIIDANIKLLEAKMRKRQEDRIQQVIKLVQDNKAMAKKSEERAASTYHGFYGNLDTANERLLILSGSCNQHDRINDLKGREKMIMEQKPILWGHLQDCIKRRDEIVLEGVG